jgi:L-aspartate oxidase
MLEFDFVVLGSGVAGLTFAIEAAKHGTVCVVSKKQLSESNTQYAQGGIASVLSDEDSFEEHVLDTLEAGAGLCRREIVEICVREGPRRVRELIELGAEFTRDESGYHLAREGGHSRRRVIHAQDLTGREVERTLVAAVHAAGIRTFENTSAIDLVTTGKLGLPGPDRVVGCYVLDNTSGEVHRIRGRVVALATGGAGKAYLYTTNPDVATGDGIAMAHRAGAAIANMEFMQFHPTCLFHPQAKNFLISEALRGEGGILRTRAGDPFMRRYHPMADLAPRDVVARAIDSELKRTGDDSAFLDMTHLPKAFLVEHFPNIDAQCRAFGIDMSVQPIPVVPAAHYTCGGVATDALARTTIANLLACGEVACTGLHGANRLASNSLLEGLVFAHRAAEHAARVLRDIPPPPDFPRWDPGQAVRPEEGVVVTQNWDEIRRFMWNYVGIVRTDKRLARAWRRIELLRDEIAEYYWGTLVTSDLLELRNLADVAALIIRSAQLRRESRGLHYTLDYPERDDTRLADTVLVRGEPDPSAWPRR